MRVSPEALRRQRTMQRRQIAASSPANTPAPYGGLNTRDSLDAMQPNQAVSMDNWFPSEGEVRVREGYTLAYSIGAQRIHKLHNFKANTFDQLIIAMAGGLFEADNLLVTSGTTTSDFAGPRLVDSTKDFVALGVAIGDLVINDTDTTFTYINTVTTTELHVDNDIFDASEDYRVIAAIGSGFLENDWNADNFDAELMLCNGADPPQRWDGTTLTPNNWIGIGFDNSLSIVHSYKNRLFYATGTNQSFWYADTVYIKTGTLVEFPLGRIGSIKGNVIAMNSWTVDGGEGIDDYFVIATSGGQLVVYQGLDPGSAINWALVGIYNVSEPINLSNCLQKVGADLMYLSTNDIDSVRNIMTKGYIGNRSLISGAIREASDGTFGAAIGWQMLLWPEGRKFMINHPLALGNNQFVQNTITGAWTRWTGINTRTWEGFRGRTYFGGNDGNVYVMGGDDDAGTAIEASCQQAYSDLGSQAEKVITAIRPVIESDGPVNYNIGISYEYREVTVSAPVATSPTGTDVINTDWKGASGKGSKLAPKLVVTAQQKIVWHDTDYRATLATNL